MLRRTLFHAAYSLAAPGKIVFVTGDDEYRSEYTMPALARILERHYRIPCSVCYARPTPQSNTNIEGLDALRDAALMVLYLRWRMLPEEQLSKIIGFAESGRPVAGFRTATHCFKYPAGHPREGENDGFPLRVFGTRWTRHHGHLSTTRTTLAMAHPILNGVRAEMTLPSWLYSVNPLQGDCQPILTGHAINPQNGRDDGPQPVAWVKSHRGGRVFFTTLGHPYDFKDESFRRMAVNGLLWALGRDVPKSGARIDVPGGFDPPPSGVLTAAKKG
jgi:type 1 glutamine amidotransferase